MTYCIYIENHKIAETDEVDFAWEIYRKTCELGDLLSNIVSLVDGQTQEVIASSDDEDYEPDYDECGFDPYEGCYTYDC